jgi:hypothetical protein
MGVSTPESPYLDSQYPAFGFGVTFSCSYHHSFTFFTPFASIESRPFIAFAAATAAWASVEDTSLGIAIGR